MAEDKSLNTFEGWEEPTTTAIDFFGEKVDIEVPLEEKKEEEVVDKKETEKKEEPKKEVEPEFFKEEPLPEEVELVNDLLDDDDIVTETKPEKADSLSSTVSFMKEEGLMDFDLPEGETMDKDKFKEAFSKKIETELEDLLGDLPPVLQQLNKFAIQGGDVQEFFEALKTQAIVPLTKDLDIEEETNQEKVMKVLLKEEGYDQDYIDTQIDFLKDSGKLKDIADKKFSLWKTKDAEREKKLFTEQQAKVEADKEKKKALKKDLSTFLQDAEEMLGLPISPKDKTVLPTYMTEQSVKLKGGGAITEMQRDLSLALQDKTKAAVLAKLLMSNFDLKSLIDKVNSKVTAKIKDNVQRAASTDTPNVKSARSTSSASRKRLADYFK